MFNISHMYVLFWFRKKAGETSSDNPKGFIQVRISYDGQRSELGSTHIECLKKQWDRERQGMAGNSVWAKEQNDKLKAVRRRVDEVYRRLELEGAEINAHLIKERCLNGSAVVEVVKVNVNGRMVEKRVTKRKIFSFWELHEYFLEHTRRKVTRMKLNPRTAQKKINYANHIHEYLKKVHKSAVPATNLSDQDAENLLDYLLLEKKYQYSHVEKHLKYLKEVMKWSFSKALIRINPVAAFNIPPVTDMPDTTHLSLSELQQLISFDFEDLVRQKKIKAQTAAALDRERDAFVFNCFTGMHHVDYISKKYTIEQSGSEFWLNGTRQKTKIPFTIKLLEPAVAVFKKYGSHLEGLPAKSNTGRNDHLHLIAAYCKLSVDLTTKIARKTFADMALNELMIDANDVAALLGLNSTRQLRHYARPRRSRLRQLLSSWDQITSRLA